MRIQIAWEKGHVEATLKETPTAHALMAALPFESSAHTWGEEVYFSAPVKAEKEEDAQQVVEPGTVCFWVEGQSLALPYGPTPISHEGECRLAARVNILGTLDADPKVLSTIRQDDPIRVSRLESGAC